MLKRDPETGAENIVLMPQSRRTPLAPARMQASVVVVPFESWVDLRDRAAASLLGGTRRVLLTGPAGTGKTVMIDHVARVLRAAGRTVAVHLADADPAPPDAGTTLFVDEADRLDARRLDALQAAAGSVVLVGLDTLVPRRLPAGTLHLRLAPLGPQAASAYVAQWLSTTGRTPADLDGMAVRRLVELSGGVPRLLTTLLAASAWLAATSGAAVVMAEHVQEAAELRSVLSPVSGSTVTTAVPVRRPGRAAWSALLAGGMAAGLAAMAAPRLFPVESRRAIDRAGALAEDVQHWAGRALDGQLPPSQGRIGPGPAPVAATLPTPAPAPRAPVFAASPAPAPMVEPALTPEMAASVAPQPAPASAEPVAPPSIASVSISEVASQALPAETVAFLLRRGREMLQLNDLSAARLLFRRAADAGSGEAMFRLGQAYDPVVLAGMGATGMADADEARAWYASAAAAGEPTVAEASQKSEVGLSSR